MHFLGVFEQISFPEIALTSSLHTALHKARKGRIIVNATHVVSVLTLDPKRTLSLGTVGPCAVDLQIIMGFGGILVPRVVDTMVGSKMLGKMVFSSKCINACVLIAMRTWELGGLAPVTLEIIEASIWFAAFALESVVVEGFGVTLELGG